MLLEITILPENEQDMNIFQLRDMEHQLKNRKNFSFNNLKAVAEPERIKRTWLSIIKQLTKEQYTLHKKDYRIYQEDGGIIRTILYKFEIK